MAVVTLIAVPYDSGQRAVRMGRGPLHLLEHGLEDALREHGHSVQAQVIEAEVGFQTEVGTSFKLYRQVAGEVKAACDSGSVPLVLSGNCGTSLGTVAGCGSSLGVIWFDAHGDFNTPETTESGFLDGMALAALTGRCWRALAATIPGFAPVPEIHIIHVGARDLDTEEKAALDRSRLTVLDSSLLAERGLMETLGPALAALRYHVKKVYLHLDLDVLEPLEACANGFVTNMPGGLSVAQVSQAIGMIKEHFTIAACGISAYDPAFDPDDHTLQAALRFASLAYSGL
jgi:arginase